MSFADTLPSSATASPLAPATETGALGVYQLKRLWSRTMAGRQGRFPPATMHDRHLDNLVVHAIGLGLEQTAAYLGLSRTDFRSVRALDRYDYGRHRTGTRGAHQRRGDRRRNAAREPARTRGRRGERPRANRSRSRVLGTSTATSCCTTPFRRPRARRRRRRCGSISAPVRTIRRRGIAAATTASWCNISSTRRLRRHSPLAAHPQGLCAVMGHGRSVGDHRPRRFQSARTRRISCFRARICIGMSA